MRLRQRGRDFLARCPFHEERTPSFSVSREKQFYYCFGCRASGTAITFLMEYDGLGFVDAVEELAERVGMEVPRTGSGPGGAGHEGRDRSMEPRRGLRGPRARDPVLPAPAPGAPGEGPGGRVPEVPRAVRGARGAVRARICAARLGRAGVGARRCREGGAGARTRRPRRPPGRRHALRPVPGPGDVPDPRPEGASGRVPAGGSSATASRST